jgi:hypothetical protein
MARKVAFSIMVLSSAAVLIAISFTVLSPIWHSVPPPTPLHQISPLQTSPFPYRIRHITGDDYWYDVAIGRTPKFEYHGGIGVAWEIDQDGTQSVNYVPPCLVFDPTQQAEGYRRAVGELIEALSKPGETATATERLESLTGNRFASQVRWRRWLETNERFLYWSASSQELKVDLGAAAISQPTKISWKTCDLSHYHAF